MKLIQYIIILFLSFIIFNCDGGDKTIVSPSKDDDNSSSSNNTTNTIKKYSVSGRAVDWSDNPISGVTITISGQQITKSTTTDRNGYYSFTNLEKGSYTITADKEGYLAVFNEGKVEIYIDSSNEEANFLFSKLVQRKTITLTASEDTYVDERHASENYGSSEHLMTGHEDLRNATGNPQKGYIYYKCALIRFDLSQIPATATIISASLELTIHYPTISHKTSNVTVSLIDHCPRVNWRENEAISFDYPSTLIHIQTRTIDSTIPSRVYYWDVREAIKKWIAESHPNYGFCVKSYNNESIHDQCDFRSREHPQGGGPRLKITYEM